MSVARPFRGRRPRTGAERQHDLRARVKLCRASYWAEADDLVLTMLVRRRYLGEDEADNDREVGRAITLFLADHAALDEA